MRATRNALLLLFLLLGVPALQTAAALEQKLGPESEPAAMGSNYQPLLWRGADAQFAVDVAHNSQCELALDRLAATRSENKDLEQLSANSIGIQTRIDKRIRSMAKTIGFKLDSKKHPAACAETERFSALSGNSFHDAYLDFVSKENAATLARFEQQAQAPRSSANYDLRKFAESMLSDLNEQQRSIASAKASSKPASQ